MPEAPLLALSIERSSRTPLVQQVYDSLRRRINSGQFSGGDRLPATRNFAAELGVSRTTVVAAYEQLVAEGYLQGRRGSGYYVGRIGPVELDGEPEVKPGARRVAGASPGFPPGPRVGAPMAFQPGLPDMRRFPYRQWARCVARVARSSPDSMIESGDPFGDVPLRLAIARHLAEWRGVNASPGQILVTAGSGDALETCIRTLAGPEDRIALEDPGYLPLRRFVQSLGMKPIWLEVGANGAEVPVGAENVPPPRLTVLTPSHQYPLGGAMPANRRTEFLSWAGNTGGWIVEDDYDSEFRYAGGPIPALTSFDGHGSTIYIGSFSKIFSAGLRMGFLVMPAALISRFRRTLSAFGTKASAAPQRALAAFMDSGEFYRHIRRMRRIYSERHRLLVDLLHSELGHLVRFRDHQAGMQIVAELPAGCNDVELTDAAARRGVFAPALSSYYARESSARGLLLGFCAYSGEEMTGPLKTLREIAEQQLPGFRGP